MIISIIGYMGSGKSHISKLLSQKLNFELIDLDKEISLKNKMSITDIFATKGEIYFRKQERELLEEILAQRKNTVLSLGGGTPCYYNNMEILNHNSTTFFLQASVSTLTGRLLKQKDRRPLIKNIADDELPEFISKHLFERNAFYAKAQYRIITDNKEPEMIVKEILNQLTID